MQSHATTSELIVLNGLEGNPPAGEYVGLQVWLAPYLDIIANVWWVIWVVVLISVFIRFALLPLLSQGNLKTAKSNPE